MRVSGAARRNTFIELPNGFYLRMSGLPPGTAKKFSQQAHISSQFTPFILPDHRMALSVAEANPEFIRLLDESTGHFLRYYRPGASPDDVPMFYSKSGSRLSAKGGNVGKNVGASLERVAYGFSSLTKFHQFRDVLLKRLDLMGIKDAEVFIVGSAASGLSYEAGKPYDIGRISDIEIEIRSRTLFEAQVQKFSDMTRAHECEYYPAYRQQFQAARLAYKMEPTSENRENVRNANNLLQKVMGSWKKLLGIINSRVMPANFKLPVGFQELQYDILPRLTDRPHMKIGIKISHPDIAESSDVNESSIRII